MNRIAFMGLAAAMGLSSGCFPPVDVESDTVDIADTLDAPGDVDAAVVDTASPPTDTLEDTAPEVDGVDGGPTDTLVLDTAPGDSSDLDTVQLDTSAQDADTTALALDAPTAVTASTDRDASILVSWEAVDGATGYLVERCTDGDGCAVEADWSVVTPDVLTEPRFVDLAAEAAPLPAAPGGLSASTDLPDAIELHWTAAPTSEAVRYQYRVIAVDESRESLPSATASGHRADAPIAGYAVRADGGPWVALAGTDTMWKDVDADAPTVTPGTASASQGTYAELVRLSVTGQGHVKGAERSYEVRSVNALGESAPSDPAVGYRAPGPLTLQWERSSGAEAQDFAPLSGATSATFDDLGAPTDGSVRWYRAVVRSEGATEARTEAVPGSRQPPPGVPGSVTASSDLVDHVLVTWQPVSGALAYRVFRDGTELTGTGGISTTSYQDTSAGPAGSWAAPTAVSASTTLYDRVKVSWTAPVRPLGAAASYKVQAVNAAGDGPTSTAAIGRRAAPALEGYEVEAAPTGGTPTWYTTGETTTSWADTAPPEGKIGSATVTATGGLHRDYVGLSVLVGPHTQPASVSYRVRGRLAGGGVTPTSTAGSGHRGLGQLTYQWQRSWTAGGGTFSDITAATGAVFNDSSAPPDGSSRHYRVRLTLDGAPDALIGPLTGWRLAFVAVGGGDAYSCALSTDGEVWCWGDGSSGQLGRPDVEAGVPHLATPVTSLGGMTSLSVGVSSTCASAQAGGTWCWGNGFLANGTFGEEPIPIEVSALDTGASIRMMSSYAGGFFTGVAYGCAVLNGGEASCWGFNKYLGIATSSGQTYYPTRVLTGPSTYLDPTATQIAGAGGHTCARMNTGEVWCWGNNSKGQLGFEASDTVFTTASHADKVSGASEVSTTFLATCALLNTQEVVCWGDASDGQLGDGGVSPGGYIPAVVSDLHDATDISSSAYTTCARSASDKVHCWGGNAEGQLGAGLTDASADAPVAALLPTGPVDAIGSGTYHHCAVVDGGVWCWGANDGGQLGDGMTDSSDVPIKVIFP